MDHAENLKELFDSGCTAAEIAAQMQKNIRTLERALLKIGCDYRKTKEEWSFIARERVWITNMRKRGANT